MAKGWQDECGISAEGVEILGWVEALPREARRELAATVEMLCRAQGYVSLNDEIVLLSPSSVKRQMSMFARCTFLPVAGMPMNSPALVPSTWL